MLHDQVRTTAIIWLAGQFQRGLLQRVAIDLVGAIDPIAQFVDPARIHIKAGDRKFPRQGDCQRKTDIAEITVEPSVADLGDTTKIVFRFSQTPSYAVEATADQVVLHLPNAHLSSASPERLLDSPRVARLVIRDSGVKPE